MNYATIKYFDIANGSGVRTSLFVSGCTHKCKGCFNEEAWDFAYGNPYTMEIQENIIKSLKPAYVAGLTLLGGEPFDPKNQGELLGLLRQVKKEFPEKDIWCFTGYLFDRDFQPGGRAYTEFTDEFLSYIDVLVDGPFIEEKHEITLRFRGSYNQRIINVQESRNRGTIVLWNDNYERG